MASRQTYPHGNCIRLRCMRTVLRLVVSCLLLRDALAFQACFAFHGTKKDLGWTYHQNLARAHAEDVLGVETRSFEGFGSVSDEERSEVIANFVSSGCKIIFMCSGAYEFSTHKVFAPRYPDVKFFILGGRRYLDLSNIGSSVIKVYQASYIAGIVAASQGITRLGYVGSTYMPDSILSVNAFYRGARGVNPEISVLLYHVGNQHMPREEMIAAMRLFHEQNVELVNYDSDSIAITKTAHAEEKKSICMKTDGAAIVGDSVLCSQILIWKQVIVDAIEAAMDPNHMVWREKRDKHRFVGFENSALSMGTFASGMSEITRANAKKAQEEFANGTDRVFCNQNEDEAYETICPDGAKQLQSFEGGRVTPFEVFGCSKIDFYSRCLTSEEKMDMTYLFAGIQDLGLLQVEGTCSDGTMFDPLSPKVCIKCPNGKYQDESDQTFCKMCERGRYNDARGVTACNLCEKGTFAYEQGQQTCRQCLPGKASDDGAVECYECGAGRSQSKHGQSECSICERGTFSFEVGSSTCSPCNGEIQGSTCQLGSKNASACTCPPGTFLKDPTRCAPCPEGLICLGGTAPFLQQAGFWGEVNESSTDVPSVFKCRDEAQCPRGELGSCASGRLGRACNNCKGYHYPTGDGTCEQCRYRDFAFISLLLGLLGLPVLLAIYMHFGEVKQEVSPVLAAFTIGQLGFALQVLGAINQLHIRWTEPLRSLLRFMALFSFDLDFLRLHCAFVSSSFGPVHQYAVKLLIYPVLVLILVCVWFVSRLVRRPIPKSILLNINAVIICLLFTSITLVVCVSLQCQKNPNGVFTMISNPGLICDMTSEHLVIFVLSILGILAYPVLILSWASWFAFVHARMVSSSHGAATDSASLLRNYRFIFGRFRPEAYYFGAVSLGRGGLVAVVSILFLWSPAFQTMAMGVLLTIGFGLQCRYLPRRMGAANLADLLIGFFLVLSVLGIATKLDISFETSSSVITGLFTATVFLILISALGGILFALIRRFNPKPMFGCFICHDKETSGVLARQITMWLQERCRHSIFLDSDHVDDAESIVDHVRWRTSNLVILFTPDVLRRVDCAREIVTAYMHKVPIVPIVLSNAEMPTEENFVLIPTSWTQEQRNSLLAFDINDEMIRDAFKYVAKLPVLEMYLGDPMSLRMDIVSQLVQRCKLQPTDGFWNMWSFCSKASQDGMGSICIVSTLSDTERLSASEIMQALIRRQLNVNPTLVSDADLLSPSDPRPNVIIVVLSGQVFEDAMFAHIVMELLGDHNQVQPQILTVVSGSAFKFPSLEFFMDIEKNGCARRLSISYARTKSFSLAVSPSLPRSSPSSQTNSSGASGMPLGPEKGPQLAKIYRMLCSSPSMPFNPLGSQGLIDKQMLDIAITAQRLIENPRLRLTDMGLEPRLSIITEFDPEADKTEVEPEPAAGCTPPRDVDDDACSF